MTDSSLCSISHFKAFLTIDSASSTVTSFEPKSDSSLRFEATLTRPFTFDSVSSLVDRFGVDDINENLFAQIQKLSPFGVGNPKPIFLIKNAEVKSADFLGKTKEHYKVILEKTNGQVVEAISFFSPNNVLNIKEGETVNLIANIEIDYFRGRKLRLKIIDVI